MSYLSQNLNSEISKSSKIDYETTILQLKSVVSGESNLVANLANTSSLLKSNHHYFWVGFYIVDESVNELVLGPFQGTLACTRIPFGKGVCGTAWKMDQSQFIPNVHEFPGHIACDSKSETEIVIVIKNPATKKIWGVLDVDSHIKGGLTSEDFTQLSKIGLIIESLLK